MLKEVCFFLSILLKKRTYNKKNVELSDWLIISRNKNNFVNGNLICVKNLIDVQLTKYKEKTIILTENISGNEEIPKNCVGIIIIILTHVSVRTRNVNCLFGVCFNDNICDEILKLINNKVLLLSRNENRKKRYRRKNEEKIEKINIIKLNDKYEKIYLKLEEFNSN
jgi:hypothetical protein